MSRRLGITSAIRAASVAAAVVAVVGCSDRSNSIMGVTPPAQTPTVLPTGNLGVVMGSVDENGNVTLTPLQGGAGDVATDVDGSVHSASLAGTQNVNVRIYANAATVTTNGPTKTWTMNIGVRNLLAFPIGSNQAGPTPTDTTGIFLALISGPTVSKTSGTCPNPCTITTTKFDGIGTFTAPNQPYVYWRERLAAKQVVAGADTVSNRRTFQFTSPSQVTNATFFLIVGADWPPPAQTSWSVFYNAPTDSSADSVAKPRWKTGHLGAFAGAERWVKANVASTTVDSIKANAFTDYFLVRHDSLAAKTLAYFDVKLKANATSNPETAFGFQDGTRLVAVGMTTNKVGFISYASFFGFAERASFVSGTSQSNVTTSGSHEYLLRKFGTDSVTLVVDGDTKHRIKATYSQLPSATGNTLFNSPTEFFGEGSTSGNGSSAWSVVSYGIGVSQP